MSSITHSEILSHIKLVEIPQGRAGIHSLEVSTAREGQFVEVSQPKTTAENKKI